MNKKSFINETILSTVGEKLMDTIPTMLSSGQGADPNQPETMRPALEEAVKEVPELSDETSQKAVVDYMIQNPDTMKQYMQTQASYNSRLASGIRETLYNLNNVYMSEGLDLIKALRIWKEARLTPNMIRDQIRNDVGYNVSLAEAKSLFKIGSDLQSGMNYDFGGEYYTDVMEKMNTNNYIKITPSVRASVEKIGQNLYRTKRANILWKIDMKQTDDGSQIPYLVRIDSVSAHEDDDYVKEGQ